jgi:dynein heavy chain
MVEKWLLQVEETMISSVRMVIGQSYDSYAEVPHKVWVLEWPGQVVLCVSCIYWTAEVTESMKVENGMEVRIIINVALNCVSI